MSKKRLADVKVGLVDADLLDGGTRHPNLALLKIAGLLHDNDIEFELITDPEADISGYDHIYMSKVFTFTKEPSFYLKAQWRARQKFHKGGTGYYVTEVDTKKFRVAREDDMTRLSRDPFLNRLKNKYDDPERPYGIIMPRQMPYYDLYKAYVESKIGDDEKKRIKYKDYLDYSIGFLTRRCYRHCPFCVNRLENGVVSCSELKWFYDPKRPHVYFWDDNFLAAPKEIWKPALQELIDKKISFQFRQGLDERQFAENPDGEEMARMLSEAHYHGDYIFAFDNWRDRPIIEKALKVWKRHNPSRPTKFYLFCGYLQKVDDQDRFYKDIWELFQRIKILMQYGCIGYVMRHEDYHNAPVANFYVQMARWCNQPAFYKKMSFWEYCYRNQSYWEQKILEKNCADQITFEQFEHRLETGFYERDKMKLCLPLKTIMDLLKMFPAHRNDLLEMFNYKYSTLRDPKKWES